MDGPEPIRLRRFPTARAKPLSLSLGSSPQCRSVAVSQCRENAFDIQEEHPQHFALKHHSVVSGGQ